MAREFDGTNDNISKSSGASILDVQAMTVAVWGKNPGVTNPAEELFYTGSALTSGNSAISFGYDASDLIKFGYRFSGALGSWSLPTDVADDSWHCLSADYDRSSTANDPNMYIDGTGGTETEAVTPSGTPKTGVAAYRMGENVGGGGDLGGAASHMTMWDIELSSNEHAILGRGVNPFLIRNESILICLPLHGGHGSTEPDLKSQLHGTVTGATKATTNPNVEFLENYL